MDQKIAKIECTEDDATALMQALAIYFGMDQAMARRFEDLFRAIAKQAPLRDVVTYYCHESEKDGAIYYARCGYEAAAMHAQATGGDVAATYATPLSFGPADGTMCGPANERAAKAFNPAMISESVREAQRKIREREEYEKLHADCTDDGCVHERQPTHAFTVNPDKPKSELN